MILHYALLFGYKKQTLLEATYLCVFHDKFYAVPHNFARLNLQTQIIVDKEEAMFNF